MKIGSKNSEPGVMFLRNPLRQISSIRSTHTPPPPAAHGHPEDLHAQRQEIYQGILNGIKQQKEMLDLHYEMWNKEKSGLHSKIFALSRVQLIVLLGLTLCTKSASRSTNNILCFFTCTAVLPVLMLTVLLYNLSKRLKCVNVQLNENSKRMAQLRQISIHLQQLGVVDLELDLWFIVPMSPCDLSMVVLIVYFYVLCIWTMNLVLSCWNNN